MRLHELEKRLKRINPHLRIRQSGLGDIAGIFLGDNYIIRLNKGEQSLMSWNKEIFQGYSEGLQPIVKKEKHRGYMQALFLLVNYRHLTTRQAQSIMAGL